MTIQELAKSINDDCESLKYFWAYGLLKDTVSIWEDENNRKYLCDVAVAMLYESELIQ